MAQKKTTRRKKKASAEPRSRGLTPVQATAGPPPAAVQTLQAAIEEDGGSVVGAYRDPLGGHWQLLALLPIERVQPTPFQRDLSEAHLERLVRRIGELDRFLDPVIAVRRPDGTYWTPNGNHRRAALTQLGARALTALVVPDEQVAYAILSLNTEKAHNLREKALEVIRMARDLAQIDPQPERDYAALFEEPQLLTLGLCYEQNGRFSGGVYQSVLKRLESFLAAKLPKALEERAERRDKLFALDKAVVAAVGALKERGFESPYLKNFVVARINPLRFDRSEAPPDYDATLDKMLRAAERFDAAKVKADQVARSGGPPEE
jgi:ParB family chromosome partitioning protein